MSDGRISKVIEQIVEQLRPNIQMDGGDISFIKFENNIVYVKMLGACIGCPAASYTLKLGIEEAIRERVPDVLEVVAVED
jgi:Fe-S cluster biogenesis protein NfuA